MTRYLSLISFTDQGITNVENSVQRASSFCDAVKSAGGQVIQQFWAIGEYDGAVIFEAPDDETAAALLLKLGQDGNVRTHSLRVYEQSEFESLAKSL